MRTVQIADDVYTALQHLAVPFEDDVNDVLRRLLGLSRAPSNGKPRSRSDRTAHPTVRGPARPLTEEHGNETDDRHPRAAPALVVVHRRTTNGAPLPQSTYRSAVIGMLKSTHEPVDAAQLMSMVEQQLASRMTDTDLEPLASGVLRWQSQTRNALMQLRHEGSIEIVGDRHVKYRGNGTAPR